MASKREQVLDAAITVLGERGPRGLTHRAVDERAGLPTGSASNYFRTRDALLTGITDRLEQGDVAAVQAMALVPLPSTPDQLAAGMAQFAVHSVTADRVRTRARYALFLEAAESPATAEAVRRSHHRLRDWAAELLRELDPDPALAKILVDHLDGLILHQLISPAEDFDPEPALRRLVRALLGHPRD